MLVRFNTVFPGFEVRRRLSRPYFYSRDDVYLMLIWWLLLLKTRLLDRRYGIGGLQVSEYLHEKTHQNLLIITGRKCRNLLVRRSDCQCYWNRLKYDKAQRSSWLNILPRSLARHIFITYLLPLSDAWKREHKRYSRSLAHHLRNRI